MKRLRVILLFLLLGAIVNVAVAWVGFTFSENSKGLFERWVPADDAANALWLRHASDGWPYAPNSWANKGMTYRRWYGLLASGRYIGYVISGGGYWRPDMTDAELREQSRGVGSFRVAQINSGFPLRSMRIEEWSGNPDQQFFTATEGHDAFDFAGFRFPKRILWSGVIINTVFYALLLRLLFAVPSRIRRNIRLNHGLCPWCGYDLSGTDHEACPECGEAIRKGNPA